MAYALAVSIGATVGGLSGAGWWWVFEVHRLQMARLKTQSSSERTATPPPPIASEVKHAPKQSKSNIEQDRDLGGGRRDVTPAGLPKGQKRKEALELADRVQKIGEDLDARIESIRTKYEDDRRRVTDEEFTEHYAPFLESEMQVAHNRSRSSYEECCRDKAQQLMKTFGDATDTEMEGYFNYPTNPGGYRHAAEDIRKLAKLIPEESN